VLAVLLGLAGIGVAWMLYGARSWPVPRSRPLQTLLERKFWFDEAYDLGFYRPAVFASRGIGRFFERPLVFGSVGGLSQGVRWLGRDTSRLQTGLVRSYALAIAASLAVVTVVFVAVR
jgi:NADH:ubiquinone oxidoreductase subunit 5 (subunit L)/multisubunit Na+/H+ antiporter MnhA subunit